MASTVTEIICSIHILLLFLPCGVVTAGTTVCSTTVAAKMGFCDRTKPYHVRATDLVGLMTLDEKIAQLGSNAPGVPRLNLPPYNWRTEALPGNSGDILGPTPFPAPILLAAAFDEELWKEIGVAVSNEARANYNQGLSGLTFWNPVTNVATDPRWGKIQDTAGEDPYLVSRYVVNFVRGLQDVEGHTNVPLETRSLKVAACCKYFTGYNMETNRYHYDAQIPARDMLETFNYPFEMCVKEGDVASVMCSHNAINGVPTCANPDLLKQTIRGSWGLHGYIVSACDWVVAAVGGHKFLNDTPADAIAQAFRAGIDLECRGDYTPKYIKEAVTQGKLGEADINQALINQYVVLMRLGLFDGSRRSEYNNLGRVDVCNGRNMWLAVLAARASIVLLQNDADVLPLPHNGTKPTIAVIGPHANSTAALTGDNPTTPCRYLTPLQAFSVSANVKYAPGCFDVKCESDAGIGEAVAAMEGTEYTIVLVGLDKSIENDGLDRQSLRLPNHQETLLNAIMDAPSHSMVIVVIISGGAVDTAEWGWRAQVLMWAGYPGPQGAYALADIILGNVSPSGRLPITWYKEEYLKRLPMTSMQLRPNPGVGFPGRTYKFYTESTIQYPFGYGLTYSRFNYTLSEVPKTVLVARPAKCRQIVIRTNSTIPDCPAIEVKDSKCTETIRINVTVNNIGKYWGSNTVPVYSIPPSNIAGTVLPIKRLIGFKRVPLLMPPKTSRSLVFDLNVCKSFSFISEDAVELLPAGEHSIVVGNDLSRYTLLNNDRSEPPSYATISIMFHRQNRKVEM